MLFVDLAALYAPKLGGYLNTACCDMSAADFASVPPGALFPAGTHPSQVPRLSVVCASCRHWPCSPPVRAAAYMMGTSTLDSSAPFGQMLPLQPDDMQGGVPWQFIHYLFLVQGNEVHEGFYDNAISP